MTTKELLQTYYSGFAKSYWETIILMNTQPMAYDEKLAGRIRKALAQRNGNTKNMFLWRKTA